MFYHLTPTRNIPNIIKNGLKTEFSDSHVDSPAIYLSDTLEVLDYEMMYEDEPCTLLSVNPNYLDKNFFESDDYETQIYLKQNPIELKKYGNWSNVPWIKSLELVGQVKYLKDIPPEALNIVKFDKKGKLKHTKLFEEYTSEVINIFIDGKDYVFKVKQDGRKVFLMEDDKVYQRLDIDIPESQNLQEDEFFMSPDVRQEIVDELTEQGFIDKINKVAVAGDKKVMAYVL
jgi:hypothetical protein